MGAGASVSRRQWEEADRANEDEAKDESSLPVTDMAGMAKLLEAKNKFMKNKKKSAACFQKEVFAFKLYNK